MNNEMKNTVDFCNAIARTYETALTKVHGKTFKFHAILVDTNNGTVTASWTARKSRGSFMGDRFGITFKYDLGLDLYDLTLTYMNGSDYDCRTKEIEGMDIGLIVDNAALLAGF